MPRAVDLSREPPPHADCYSCGRTVALDRRARSRGLFRCPHCHADNRVGADGVGRPVSGVAERVEEMPRFRCVGCGATNHLPLHTLRRGAFTCFACRRAQPVPPTFRRRAGIVSPWLVAGLLTLIVGALGYGTWRTATITAEGLAALLPSGPQFRVGHDLVLEGQGPELLGYRGDGYHVAVSGRLHNIFDRPATFHVRIDLLDEGGRRVVSRLILLQHVQPGAWARFRTELVDPRGTTRKLAVDLAGIS